MKSTNDIRQAFLDYFHDKGHEKVASSPLVPGNDPTLLFTNAGMVQFKETFLGQEKRAYKRATSVQRCVRAGGKHNDLENVGYTARHHTFFEMLGNFSFGDYFKREAIQYAWEFLTKVLELPADKLWITVYEEDDETADIWLKEIGVDESRFSRIGAKDNFWSMGDTGPCGPCTEIFYDHGEKVPGGPPGTPEEDGDRYIEIWNLVFMQYDRDKDGKLTPLPAPSVDTGMGLERLAAILQNGHENYDIDLFQNLIRAVAKLANTDDLKQASLRVIADHIRACSFLVVDGVIPSNEGRGYVLRRIIRRAIRHGYKLGITETFFYKLVGPLCDEMGDAYPELPAVRDQVERVLRTEEERFAVTLDLGMKMLEEELSIERRFSEYARSQSKGLNHYQRAVPNSGEATLSFTSRHEGVTTRQYWEMMVIPSNKDNAAKRIRSKFDSYIKKGEESDDVIEVNFIFVIDDDLIEAVMYAEIKSHISENIKSVFKYDVIRQELLMLSGETAFKLYDTYGFPVDLIADTARERNIKVDTEAFENKMNAQRERARAAGKFHTTDTGELDLDISTPFTGYEHLAEDTKVIALFHDGQPADSLEEGQEGVVVLEQTPFYAESGGQAGDIGVLAEADVNFDVSDTQKVGGDTVLHIGKMSRGALTVGDMITAEVDTAARQATVLNHSATHLMHAALRNILGDHVAQKGSLVDAERLRFDFSHFEPVTPAQLSEIENMVNAHIRANHAVETKLMAIDDARESGAMALFGEKYADEVRVLSMSDFSVELCGGTHARHTGDIGVFKIINETGTAAGVRRIEAVTGNGALQRIANDEARLDSVAKLLKGSRDDVDDKVAQLLDRQRKLEKELDQLKGKLASSAGSDLASQAVEVGGINILAARLDGADAKALRDTVDQLKNKLGTSAIILGAADGNKVTLIAGVSKDATDRIKAGELVNSVAQQVGGKGGGRPDMAQAGGNDPAALDGALNSVVAWVEAQIGA